MRACTGETVKVYKAVGDTMTDLLAELARAVPPLETPGTWVNLTVNWDSENEQYVSTVYVH